MRTHWRRSSRSQNNGACVEAGVWRKSTRSVNDGSCVEAGLHNTAVATRDSKFPQGGTLVMSRDDWRGFLSSVQS